MVASGCFIHEVEPGVVEFGVLLGAGAGVEAGALAVSLLELEGVFVSAFADPVPSVFPDSDADSDADEELLEA